MKIECSKCGDVVETTAKTIVAPFVCESCNCDCGTCQPLSDASVGHTSNDWTPTAPDKLYEYLFTRVSDSDLRKVFLRLKAEIPTLNLNEPESEPEKMADKDDFNDGDSLPPAVLPSNWSLEEKAKLLKVLANPDVQKELSHMGESIDYTAVAAMLSTPNADACDTTSVENTTLLIEDLQQQLADERATIVALEAEKENLEQQVLNQADLIKLQEGHIDQDLSALVRLMREKDGLKQQVELLDQRNLRQHKSIAIYQDREDVLVKQLNAWIRRAHSARSFAIARKERIKELEGRGLLARIRNTGV